MKWDVITRFKLAHGLESDAALAEKLEKKANSVAMWKKRDSIDYESIITKCDESIDLNWLLTGNGEMRKKELITIPDLPIMNHNGLIRVPVLQTGAGGGVVNYEDEMAEGHFIDPRALRKMGVNPDKAAVGIVSGTSMLPHYRPGYYYYFLKDSGYDGPGEYVIEIEDEGNMLKCVEKYAGGVLRIWSTNTVDGFGEDTYTPTDATSIYRSQRTQMTTSIHIIGRVVVLIEPR